MTNDLSFDAGLRERILGGFRGEVPPLKPSFAYRLALFGAAGAMLLMPVLYAGLIGGALWGLWLYASGIDIASVARDMGVAVVAVWLLPLVIGLVVVGFLVKPLFVKTAKQEGDLRLDPAREPLFFELVQRVCSVLGAPVPREIHVSCEANAGASFHRGLLSLFSDDMALLIGLPLIEGLTMQQLAGVMAHEMGHFSQKAGLRLSFAVRILNGWLMRLVYQRDRFDVMLERGTDPKGFLLVRMTFHTARFLVWLSRSILWALMMTGHMLSSFVMRQLEYDADRYQVRLAGFSSLDVSLRELFALHVAHGLAIADLQEQWKDKRLVDNLPRLVLANRKDKVRQIAANLEAYLSAEQEELFATHPTARQRTAQALREKGVGVFSSELPATALFADLPQIEREASLTFYRSVLGNQVRPADLIEVQTLRDRQQQSGEERSALGRFFQNTNKLRGIPLPPRLSVTAGRAAGFQLLEEARRAVAESSGEHARAIQEQREAIKKRFGALRAQALLKVGYTIRYEEHGLPDGDQRTALRVAAQALEQMGGLGPRLAEYERLEVRRLEVALALLGVPEVAARLAGASVAPDEVERLLACGSFLAGRFPRLFGLRETRAVVDILAVQLRPDENPPALLDALRQKLAGLQVQLKELHRALRAQPYPFDHGRQETTLAQYVIPFMPAEDDLLNLATMADGAMERIEEIEERLLGRLAWLAEKVEGALGLPPLGRSIDAAAPGTEAAAATPKPATVAATIAAGVRIAESKAEAVESREVFLRYFRGALDLRPVPLPEQAPEPPDDPQATIEGLWAALLALKKEGDAHALRLRAYRGADQRWVRAIEAEGLLQAGFSLSFEDFDLIEGDLDLGNAVKLRERSMARMKSLEPALLSFEEIQRQRLTQALALLGEPQVARQVDAAGRWRPEVAPLVAAGTGLHLCFPGLRELRKSQIVLGILAAQPARGGRRHHERLAEGIAEAHRQLRQLQRDLHTQPYLFDDDRVATTLAQKAVPDLPSVSDYEGVFIAVGRALRELADLQRRMSGRLAGMAERVEHTLGLDRLT